MRKTKIMIIGLLLCTMFAAVPLAADIQFDIGINVPFLAGIKTVEDDYNEYIDKAFVVLDFKVHYFWGDSSLRTGVGIRAFTIILETFFYPTVTAELDISNFRFTGSIGGGVFTAFGLYNHIATGNVWVPEITAAYKVNDWFHLGAGVSGLAVFEEGIFEDNLPYLAYAMARFSLRGSD